MDGNAHFPSPDPSLSEITAKRAELLWLISTAANGDRVAIANRNMVYSQLESSLRKLATYVSLMANGSESAILSSGFEVRKSKEPLPPVTRPVHFSAKRMERQGEIKLKWKKVIGGVSYIIEMTTEDPSQANTIWIQAASTPRCSHTVIGLEPGTNYYFRVSALGRKQISAFSNVEMIMAA